MHTLTGHSSNTVTVFWRYCIQLVANMLDTDDGILGGEGIMVQVDETKLGKRKFHRGHRVDGVWVIVGV